MIRHGKKSRPRVKKTRRNARTQSRRAHSLRTKPGSDPRRTVASSRKLPSLAHLLRALEAEGIQAQVVGMSAAILQGVPATTLDTDLWVNLGERQYIRVPEICRKLGASVLAPTAVALKDESLVNFCYRIDGLRSFAWEWKHSKKMRWLGLLVRVLPLERIIRSKEVIRRPKDLAHLPLLKQVLRASRRME